MHKHWNPESHWDEHPEYPVEDWQHEVMNDETRQSYVEWVNSGIECDTDVNNSPPSKVESHG